jgi:translation initiation factor 1
MAMRKRGEASEAADSRLVYSTGGEKPPATSAAAAPTGSARAGGGKGIRLRLDTRPGGRVVTLVLGLVGTEAQLADLARALKSACGTGGTLKDRVVELQGDHRKAAQTELAARGMKSRVT